MRRAAIHAVLSMALGLACSDLKAQDVGLPFLKLGVGARQIGLGGTFTGLGDDIHTLYWNPGGLGHIRTWQWSASYTRYFLDVTQASFDAVRQLRLLGSRKTAVGLSLVVVGMPAWDATGGKESSVTAGHWVAGISIGQRLDWISKMISIGVNVRLISSQLDSYEASVLSSDFGLLLNPGRFSLGRFGLGVFDYGILTCGAAVLNVGKDVTFDQEATRLPRTLRFGAALRFGRHKGWNWLMSADVISVQGHGWTGSVGGELVWRDFVGLRGGYQLNGKDLGGLFFGLGFRWEGLLSMLKRPTRYGDVFQIDLAHAGFGEGLDATYRGTVTHFPVAPESFRLRQPHLVGARVLGVGTPVHLSWEKSTDPDPYDRVDYLILVDKQEAKIERAIHRVERDMDAFLDTDEKDSLLICDLLSDTSYTTRGLEGGIYYWAVAAFDMDRHARLADRGEKDIASFEVSTADLIVRDLSFSHLPWITETPEQGTIEATVSNAGEAPAGPFRLQVRDLEENRILLDALIPGLDSGSDTTISFKWETEIHGSHSLEAVTDADHQVLEIHEENNARVLRAMTIPKGSIGTPDSLDVMATGYDTIELPLVPEIYFEASSSKVDESYYHNGYGIPSVLRTLAKRLEEHPDITIELMGSIDRLSGERDRSLAAARAEAVQTILVRMGARESQVRILKNHANQVLGNRSMPLDSLDARHIMQQNRVVSMRTAQRYELRLFRPIQAAVDTTLGQEGVPFEVSIRTSVAMRKGAVSSTSGTFHVPLDPVFHQDSLQGTLPWDGMNAQGNLVQRNRSYDYQVMLEDTLGRVFRTHPSSVFLREKRTLRRWEMFGAAKFAETKPVYEFYWDRLMSLAQELDQNPFMRVRFEGHACAIGSEAINDTLSLRRARSFIEIFKEKVKQAYPGSYQSIWDRIDAPAGYGERIPLAIHLRGHGEVLFGDNQTPVGRYLNRRIMVLLYSEIGAVGMGPRTVSIIDKPPEF